MGSGMEGRISEWWLCDRISTLLSLSLSFSPSLFCSFLYFARHNACRGIAVCVYMYLMFKCVWWCVLVKTKFIFFSFSSCSLGVILNYLCMLSVHLGCIVLSFCVLCLFLRLTLFLIVVGTARFFKVNFQKWFYICTCLFLLVHCWCDITLHACSSWGFVCFVVVVVSPLFSHTRLIGVRAELLFTD